MPAFTPKISKKPRNSSNRESQAIEDADDKYFRKHLSTLVREHGGQWVVIAAGKLIGTGKKSQIGSLLSKARKSYPQATPFIAPIPTEDEIECAL